MSHVLFGIDYESKLCGNTVVSILQNNRIYFMHVDEDVDADAFIVNAANHFKPQFIFINAPLSLPGVYLQKEGFTNHQFRIADSELSSVSPMIIGGLTARAMELKQNLESIEGVKVYETCSKAQAKNYELCEIGYKKNKLALIGCRNHLNSKLSAKMFFNCQDVKTWHHLDSFLSLITAMRFTMGLALPYGDEKEGVIYV